MTNNPQHHPVIIQGGMGVGVSGWRLANAVSRRGQLGVVSGTALDVVLVRRLQMGDAGGHVRRALDNLPLPGVAERIIERYFIRGGKATGEPFRAKPMPSDRPSARQTELLVASNFVEVFLAREGHDQPVGINYLEKIQAPTLASLYGAMLAGVAYVLMGAGIPKAIPAVLDRLAQDQPVELSLDIQGSDTTAGRLHFDPQPLGREGDAPLHRPNFLAIIASTGLATMLSRRASGRIDGFVVEGHTAGGHNAPPRGPLQLSADGQPIYSDRDRPDYSIIKDLGLPFWIAGSCDGPRQLGEARRVGAVGVQLGTAFAYCEESDIDASIKARVLGLSRSGEVRISTDPIASPTGFPFKVVQLPGTLADPEVAQSRERVCDLGYLRHAYRKSDGSVGWRCPAEPVADYVRKGGDEADTRGRLCLCNGLLATIGLGQTRDDGHQEPAVVTSGDEVSGLARFLKPGAEWYHAGDVIDFMLAPSDASTGSMAEPPLDAPVGSSA